MKLSQKVKARYSQTLPFERSQGTGISLAARNLPGIEVSSYFFPIWCFLVSRGPRRTSSDEATRCGFLSVRLAEVAIELFHFRGLLIVWATILSTSIDPYFQLGKVNGARKAPFTLSFTHSFILMIEQVPKGQRVALGAAINLDAGKTACWAGATPLSHTIAWPKWMVGRSSPTRSFARCARARREFRRSRCRRQ